MNISKIIGIIFVMISLSFCMSSCTKSVYVQSDADGNSSFTLYKKTYKYTEKTDNTDFEIWGTYRITNNNIVFVYKDPKKLPYNYLGDNLFRSKKVKASGVTEIKVIDKLTRKSAGLCTIEAKDSLGHTINRFGIDYSGIIELNLEQEYKRLEVSCHGYANQKVDCDSMDIFDYLVEMEEIQMGGRAVGNCLVYYIDVLLEFKIDSQSNLMYFERNDNVFKKAQKK